MSKNVWSLHKFGGTSLANASCYRNVHNLLKKNSDNSQAIVVSSMAGGTDALLTLLEMAKSQDPSYKAQLEGLKKKHLEAIAELLSGDQSFSLSRSLEADISDLEQVLQATWLIKSYAQTTQDWLVGYGELWSARLLSAYLQTQGQNARWLDAREVLFVQQTENGAEVLWEKTQTEMQKWLEQNPLESLVITGFIASTEEGLPTTLKRDGSDFSASIFGALLQAKTLTIWTDVHGVFSADPRRVPEAVLLQSLSWQEAMELAYFGAKVLHPHAMAPAISHNIPITIRNSFAPEVIGTQIGAPKPTKISDQNNTPIKGFSTIDGVALLNLEGAGMIGVPGIANRLFGALREVGVSVIVISQASSEHSICFAVPGEQANKAKQVVKNAFYREFQQKTIHSLMVFENCSILAAVGDQMVERIGVAAQFFGALSKAGVNVRAIAQGSSERNISAVIDQVDSSRALRAVHAGFYLSEQTLSIGLVGPGLIGQAFLEQLQTQTSFLREQFKIELRVRGITNSQKMLLSEQAISLDNWQEEFEKNAEPADLEKFASHIKANHLPHAAIVDCTASNLSSDWYPKWLSQRIHVITPNKKANSDTLARYNQLKKLCSEKHSHYFYEATVGAGLPVISTLRDLLQTGDQMISIEGVLSGTLSYIFNNLSEQMTFSKIVKQAKQQGYTEPDPRDDLSGTDVARKVVILAREIGLTIELQDIKVQNLVPEPLQSLENVDEFMQKLENFDQDLLQQHLEAQSQGKVLCYVGSIDAMAKTATVALRSYPKEHAFAGIQGSDNIIAFRTHRYDQQPLIIRGPGAGPEVTAAGVFADLLRLTGRLGARS